MNKKIRIDALIEQYLFTGTDCHALKVSSQHINKAGAAFTLTQVGVTLKLLSDRFPQIRKELSSIISQTEALIQRLH